jgi:hypothetical protein
MFTRGLGPAVGPHVGSRNPQKHNPLLRVLYYVNMGILHHLHYLYRQYYLQKACNTRKFWYNNVKLGTAIWLVSSIR